MSAAAAATIAAQAVTTATTTTTAASNKGLALQRVYNELRSHLGSAVGENVRQLFKSKPFYWFLAASLTSAGAMTIYEVLNIKKLVNTSRKDKNNKSKTNKPGQRKQKVRFKKKFVQLLKLCFPRVWSRGTLLLAVQFILLVMRTLLTVKATKLNVYYLTKAITKASWSYWTKWLVSFGGWMACGVTINASLKYFESLIALVMRRKLTTYVHDLYTRKNGFYRAIVLKEGGLDNVDARIAGDIDHLCAQCAVLYGHSFKPILEFAMTLVECVGFLGWQRPVALFSWNIVMDVFLRAISPRIGPLISREQELEGDFRRAHARLIENAEEVAFLQGGEAERAILNNRLHSLIDTKRAHGFSRLKKDIGTQIFKFQGPMIGGVFVHIPFLLRSSMSESARISSFRATEVLMLKCGGSFSEILMLGKNLQEISGYVSRIHDVITVLKATPSLKQLPVQASSSDCIEFKGFTLKTPTTTIVATGQLPSGEDSKSSSSSSSSIDNQLVRNLDVVIRKGQSVIVTGPNGVGKTSLFRSLAGLWPSPEGSISTPGYSQVMWLPQRAYMVLGTLRDQISYPRRLGLDRSHDTRIAECLAEAGLQKILGGVDTSDSRALGHALDMIHEEWNKILSGGERQRIAFARVYFAKPMFAVLDECTSAVNADDEFMLYENLVKQGVTVISIAHRLALKKFHQYELSIRLDPDGHEHQNWSLIRL